MEKKTIINLFEFHKKWIVRMASDIDNDTFFRQQIWDKKHPCWLIGHLAVTCDLMLKWMRDKSFCCSRWYDLFEDGSEPQSNPELYPSKDEIVNKYIQGHTFVANRFLAVNDDILLSSMPIMKDLFSTVYEGIVFEMLCHEGIHAGQLRIIWNYVKNKST